MRQYYTDYFYIPKSYVTDDSYIEVEILPSYEYSKNINFDSLDDVEEIELLDNGDDIYPTAQDVYYISPNGHIYDKLPMSNKKINSDSEIIDTSVEAVKLIMNDETY